MTWRVVAAIAAKDLRAALRSPAVTVPIVVVPLVVLALLPALFAVALSFAPLQGEMLADLQDVLERMPPQLLARLPDEGDLARLAALAFGYLLAPLYLIVPLMVSSVVAADSFVGEKERGTLEPLLHTPATDHELLLGKMLAAWLPALAAGAIGFVVAVVATDLATWSLVGGPLLPNALWWTLALWVGPAAAALGLAVTVLVSARVQTFQAAYQLGGVLVLPVIALLLSQVAGLLVLSSGLAFGIGAVAWTSCGLLLGLGARSFSRDRLWTGRAPE